jgi:hypothetical protein
MISRNDTIEPVIPKNGRMAVCTVILAKYDELKKLPEIEGDIAIDFFCFTDDPFLPKDYGWRIITYPYHMDDTEMDICGRKSISIDPQPNNISKYYKTCLHRIPILRDYSRLVSIDASLEIIDLDILKRYNTNTPDNNNAKMVVYGHPYRNSILAEAKSSKLYARYEFQPVVEQAESYLAEHYPDEYLVSTGFIIHENSSTYNMALMYWYFEIQKWTDACQTSFPYALWLFDVKPEIINALVYWNDHIHFHQHKYNY